MKVISTPNAPQAIGAYSQAIQIDNLLFLSGQIGLNPKTTALISDKFSEQTEQVFKNIKQVALAANADFNRIAKLTIFLQNLDDYDELNKIMQKHFKIPFPTRSVVQVTKLPKGALIEIEAIIYLG